MKNKFFALGAAVLLLASCSDDDGPSINYDHLTKKWYNVSERFNGETYEYDDHEPCGKDYVQFIDGDSGIWGDVSGCMGDEPIVNESDFSYMREGRTIVLSAFGVVQEVVIQELTSSTLKVKVMYDYDGDGDDDSVIETYTSNPN